MSCFTIKFFSKCIFKKFIFSFFKLNIFWNIDKYWAGFDAFVTNRSPSAVIPPEELRAIDAAVGGTAHPGATASVTARRSCAL